MVPRWEPVRLKWEGSIRKWEAEVIVLSRADNNNNKARKSQANANDGNVVVEGVAATTEIRVKPRP